MRGARVGQPLRQGESTARSPGGRRTPSQLWKPVSVNAAPLRQRRPTRPWEEDRGVRSSHAVGRHHCRPPGRLGSRRGDWAAIPPTAQVSTPLQSKRKGRDRGERGAQGPRSAAPGEEKRLFSAQTPRPGRGRGLGDRGWGLIPGPPPPALVSPGVHGPPAYSGGFR